MTRGHAALSLRDEHGEAVRPHEPVKLIGVGHLERGGDIHLEYRAGRRPAERAPTSHLAYVLNGSEARRVSPVGQTCPGASVRVYREPPYSLQASIFDITIVMLVPIIRVSFPKALAANLLQRTTSRVALYRLVMRHSVT